MSVGDQPPPNNKNQPGTALQSEDYVQRVRLNSEELRVLKECNRESFYYRCVPFGAVAMAATHMAVKTGYLKPNPRWGSMFKVMGAGLVSYFIGKFSYQKRCAEKLMELQNSPLGEALRVRYGRKGFATGEYDTYGGFVPPPDATSMYSDIESKSSDIDTDKNIQHTGLDDSFRPTMDSPTMRLQEPDIPEQKSITYDDMRKKNRTEHESKRNDMYKKDLHIVPVQPMPPQPSSEPEPERERPRRPKGKNKYGDEWED